MLVQKIPLSKNALYLNQTARKGGLARQLVKSSNKNNIFINQVLKLLLLKHTKIIIIIIIIKYFFKSNIICQLII